MKDASRREKRGWRRGRSISGSLAVSVDPTIPIVVVVVAGDESVCVCTFACRLSRSIGARDGRIPFWLDSVSNSA